MRPISTCQAMTIGVTLALVAGHSACQVQPVARACRLLPTAQLEAVFGGKVRDPIGLDEKTLSSCAVNINGHSVEIESAPAGAPDQPATIEAGLAVVTELPRRTGGIVVIEGFGSISCVQAQWTKDYRGKPLPKVLYQTGCFMVQGGYLMLRCASDDPNQVSFARVKEFLEQAAARRG